MTEPDVQFRAKRGKKNVARFTLKTTSGVTLSLECKAVGKPLDQSLYILIGAMVGMVGPRETEKLMAAMANKVSHHALKTKRKEARNV